MSTNFIFVEPLEHADHHRRRGRDPEGERRVGSHEGVLRRAYLRKLEGLHRKGHHRRRQHRHRRI